MKSLGTGRWLIVAADVTKPLMVKTGMSAVSAENAQLNLKKEIPGWDFRQVVADADEAWNRELNKVNIETTDSASRRIFYTAMYHTMTAPSVFSDVNGQYRGADGKVYDGNFTNYTTLLALGYLSCGSSADDDDSYRYAARHGKHFHQYLSPAGSVAGMASDG